MFAPDDQAAIIALVTPLLERTLGDTVAIAGRATPVPTWRPGTCTAIVGTLATVVTDEPGATAFDASVIGRTPTAGARVMVVFVPPGAVFCFAMNDDGGRGVVGIGERTSADLTGLGNGVDLTDCAVSFAATGTRRMKVSWSGYGANQTGAGAVELYVVDASNVALGRQIVSRAAGATPYGIGGFFTHTPPTGPFTYKLRNVTSGGTPTVDYYAGAAYPLTLLVEDIGAA